MIPFKKQQFSGCPGLSPADVDFKVEHGLLGLVKVDCGVLCRFWGEHQVSTDDEVLTDLRLDQSVVVVVHFLLEKSEFIKLWFITCCFSHIFLILSIFFHFFDFINFLLNLSPLPIILLWFERPPRDLRLKREIRLAPLILHLLTRLVLPQLPITRHPPPLLIQGLMHYPASASGWREFIDLGYEGALFEFLLNLFLLLFFLGCLVYFPLFN